MNTGGASAFLLLGAALVGAFAAAPSLGMRQSRLAVYVGTYTDASERGIYRFELDPVTGAASEPLVVGTTRNPSFLALHPNGRVLYAVNEVSDFGGRKTGAVTAFAVDRGTGRLTPLNQQPSGGADPCHLAIDGQARNLLVANYSSGSVAVLPIEADGRLRPASTVVQQAGTGPNKARQAGPHAHAIVLDGQERFALSADLGADRIFVYRYDGEAGRLEANDPPAAALEPGSGPRHLAWHPNGQHLYVIEELASSIAVLRYDATRGALARTQAISTLPPRFSGRNTAAEVAFSPNGRFLYASNRGHDSIAGFRVDPATGALELRGHVPSRGRTPRNFAIDPSGRWLLAANQDSSSVAVFRLDPENGLPSPVGAPIPIPRPVCVAFAGGTVN